MSGTEDGSTLGKTGILRPSRSDDAPAWLIQRTARLLRVLFMRLVQSSGVDLTPEMWSVLGRLTARDGQYQSELAESTYRDRPNTSRILAGMEARGLVARRADREDRRRVRCYLTTEGRALVSATAPLAVRTRDRLYAGLERDELEALRRALRRVEANGLALLEELDAVEGAGETGDPRRDTSPRSDPPSTGWRP